MYEGIWQDKDEFEEDELEYIGERVKDGYKSGVTPYGTTWSIELELGWDGEE